MNNTLRLWVGICMGWLAIASPAWSAAKDDLSQCYLNATSGRDRVDFARWIFGVMSAHPQVTKLSNVSAQQRIELNQRAGQIVTRLLTVDCKAEAIAVTKADPNALGQSFESLGRVAMQELMGNPSVAAAINEYTQYIDSAAINAAFK